jgi:Uma2 family endonuclease
MARARSHPWTVDDFLALEAEEPERYEFVDGVVRMMTGTSPAHSSIKLNLRSRSKPLWVQVHAGSMSTTSRS